MPQYKEIAYGVEKKTSKPTAIFSGGVEVSAFHGKGNTCGPPPPSPPHTRSAAAAEAAQLLPFQDKATQTPARIPVSSSVWRRRMNADPKPRIKKNVVVGGVYRLDGGKVDPALKRKYSLRKRKAPKRQFSKKPKASTKTPAAKRLRVPLATKIALVDAPVGTSLSSRGRVIRKSAQFDPSLLRSKLKSISHRTPDGLYSVVVLMTEEEVLQAGGGNVLNAYAKAKGSKK